MTLPPSPPSPPEGPPRGTNGSRRNVATPLPPLPARTSMVHSSMNCIARSRRAAKLGGGDLGGGLHADATARGAPGLERRVLDHAVDQREDGEVAAQPDVLAGVDDGALLPHQDVAR